jgi:hypothetical protein
VPVQVSLAKPKQTLLGIAPIVVVGPSQPAVVKAASVPPASASPPSSSELSSSPTATAVTTPSKPYIPKDHPLTPAVVISGEALAEVEGVRPKDDRARIAQTIPGQTRSAPMAALTPLPAAAAIGSAKPAPSTLDDTYPPIKQRGSKLPAVIGGLALLAAGGIAIAKLSSSPTAEKVEGAASPGVSRESPTAAFPATEPTPPPAAAPAEASAPRPPSPAVATSDAKVQAAEAAPTPEPPAKKTKAPAKKASAAPVPRRPAARPEPKAPSAPATEPAAPTTPKPTKGVIVRETPF